MDEGDDGVTKTEAVFLWISVWLYGLGFLAFLYGMVFRKDKGSKWGWHLTMAGFASQTGSMATRWWVTGHPPVMGSYENSMLGGWFIILLFTLMRSWQRRMEVIGIVIVPVVILMIGNGAMSNPVLTPLSPPYQSNWLWFHVFFAWVAYGAFCIGAGLGAMYLVKERRDKTRELRPKAEDGRIHLLDRLPDLHVINDLTLKIIIFGFIALTVEMGAGAIWAYGLWGRYWGWDPIETWSLITWLTYGTYIHLGVTLGWKGRRMAWLAIFAIIFEFITFGGIGYLGGIHTPIL